MSNHSDCRTVICTERLLLREMKTSDFHDLSAILCDDEVMYAYEGAFSLGEAQEWLDKQLMRYAKYGFGLWAVVLKETNKMIGQCGLTMQDIFIEEKSEEVLEVGYLFNKNFWHKGYAIEAARACKEYAYETLKADKVYSIIRDSNEHSIKVAKNNQMKPIGSFNKFYKNIHMPHIVYCASKTEIKG